MDIRIRLLPAALVVILFAIRSFVPDFLGATAFWFVTWFWLIMIPLLYLGAFLLTPVFVTWINSVAKRAFVLPSVFIALAIGALWVGDTLWNETFAAWFGLPELHMIDAVTAAFRGGA